jgi:O-antigen/teichoic acid export membrane protein
VSDAASKSVIARNTLWSVVGYAVQFVTPIVLVPYTVSRVTVEQYGLWVNLLTLANWFGFYDLGIWGPIVRDVADRKAKGDLEGLRTLWATWFTFDLVVGVILVLGAAAIGPDLLRQFDPGADVSFKLQIFVGLAAQFVLTAVMRHLINTLQGLQRHDLTNLMALAVTPFWVAGQIAFLELGWGLRGITLNGLLFAIVQVVVLLILVKRIGYPMSFSPARFSGAEFRRLMQQGWKFQLSWIFSQGFRNDRVILGRRAESSSVIAVYHFGATVIDRLAGSVTVLSSGLFSAASDLIARGDLPRVRVLFLRGTKYHALAAVGLLGFAALFGNELMVFWMGKSMQESVLVLRIMVLGGMATAIGSCGQSVAAAMGRQGWVALCSGMGLASTVILYMIVGRRYDYVRLAACVSVGLALIQIAFMIGLRGFLEFRWREYVGNALLKPAVLAVPLAGVYAGWWALARHLPPVDSRPRAFLVLSVAFLVSTGLGWLMARTFRVVDDYDLDVLKSPGRSVSA